MHDVKELVRDNELQPLTVLQQLAFVRRRKEDAGIVERQRRGVAVRKVRGVEDDKVSARARLPGKSPSNARIEALALDSTPAKARVHPVELQQLRARYGCPKQQQQQAKAG